MKNVFLLTLFISISIFSQESIETRFIDKAPLNIEKLIDVLKEYIIEAIAIYPIENNKIKKVYFIQ